MFFIRNIKRSLIFVKVASDSVLTDACSVGVCPGELSRLYILVMQFKAAFVKLCYSCCLYFSFSLAFYGLRIIHRTARIVFAMTSVESTSFLQKQTCAMNLTSTSLLEILSLLDLCWSEASSFSTKASHSVFLYTCLNASRMLGYFKM